MGEPIILEIDLIDFSSFRAILKIPAIAIRESGRYWFVVEQETDEAWREVSRIPLYVFLDVVQADATKA